MAYPFGGIGKEPVYKGVERYFSAAQAPYASAGKAICSVRPYTRDDDPSELDELLGTCTFKNAEDIGPREDTLEPFYIDMISEERTYMWRRVYPMTEEEEGIYPLPEHVMEPLLLDEANWAEA